MAAHGFNYHTIVNQAWQNFQHHQNRFISVAQVAVFAFCFVKRLLYPVAGDVFCVAIFYPIKACLTEIMAESCYENVISTNCVFFGLRTCKKVF